MTKKGILVGGATSSVLIVAGFFVLINSMSPIDKNEILLNDSFIVPANNYEYRIVSIHSPSTESVRYIASFTVSNGPIKFFPFDSSLFLMWQQGQFEPNWAEIDHADYGISGSGGTPDVSEDMYFLFLNEDSTHKEVSLQVIRVWDELNYVGLLGGATLILAGMIVGIFMIYKLR